MFALFSSVAAMLGSPGQVVTEWFFWLVEMLMLAVVPSVNGYRLTDFLDFACSNDGYWAIHDFAQAG